MSARWFVVVTIDSAGADVDRIAAVFAVPPRLVGPTRRIRVRFALRSTPLALATWLAARRRGQRPSIGLLRVRDLVV